MKVIIVGGSGFIGSRISSELIKRGHSIVSVDRNPPPVSGVGFLSCSCEKNIPYDDSLKKPDAIINLAGRSIAGPWDKEHKDSIYLSRIATSKNLVYLMKNKEFRPKVFIQASATGFYGDRGEEVLSEGSSRGENTFLSKVASDWEKEGSQASRHGVRTVILRQGNVLGQAGFLASLRPIYEKGLGGPVGSGNNWLPWIHIEDLLSIYIKVLENETASGIFNAVAPESVRYKDFSKTYAQVLGKPHFLKIPRWVFRIKYKGFTNEITASQKVASLRLWELGKFMKYKTLEEALIAIEKNNHDKNR